MKPVIEIVNLYKSYTLENSNLQVLQDINLTIGSSEFVSIMGPSGSGKSTLLYLIVGLDKPTSGDIIINGKSIASMKDSEESVMRRRDIGFVFQFYNLIPNLNVEENIMVPLMLDGKKPKDYKDKLQEILKDVGLIERRNHTPRELSGGQQQRVAIARALISNPGIILADEPTGNLDSKTGLEIMELFMKINKERGKTIIQVTHSNDAARYGNRLINLKDGKVVNI